MSTSLDKFGIPSFIANGTKPDAHTIDKAYLAVLEAQLVPPGVRGNLASKLVTSQKWDQIVAYQSMIGNAEMSQNAAFGDTDKTLLNNLKSRQRPDITEVLKLKSRISTCNKFWMDSFIGAGGINIITYAMETRLSKVPLGELDAAILFELISCVKAIINSGTTMKRFLSTNGALRTLTYSMLFEWKPLVLQVLEVLSVVCDYSNDAAAQIVKHIRHLARLRREAPFAIFAHALIDADVDVKAAVMQLINNLLAGTDKLADRMVMRNELKALRFSKICELAADDLSYELEDIRNLVPRRPHTLKRQGSNVSTDGRISDFLSRTQEIEAHKSMRSSEDAKGARKERMRARHPSERNFPYLFNNDSELTQLADDRKTPIDPEQGIMAGSLTAGKNRAAVTKGFLKDFGSKATKTRFYYCDGHNLSWWALEEDFKTAASHGSIQGTEIQDLRHYSSNEDLHAISEHNFEIVTPGRIHSFACDSEDAKDNWMIALSAIRDKALLIKCSYTLSSSDLDSQEFTNHATMFRKQIIVFEAIGNEDYQRSITKSGVDVTDPISLTSFLNAEMSSAGLGDKLMELLQELIVIPADSEFGAMFWENVIRVCRDMRVLSKPGDKNATPSVKLDTEATMRLLRKKEKTPAGKAAVDLNKLTLDLFTKNAEIDRLNAEIQALRSGAGSPRAGGVEGENSFRVRSARITMPVTLPSDKAVTISHVSSKSDSSMDTILEGRGERVSSTASVLAGKLPPKPPPRVLSQRNPDTPSTPDTTSGTPSVTPLATTVVPTSATAPESSSKVQASANLAAMFGARPPPQKPPPPAVHFASDADAVKGTLLGDESSGEGETKADPAAALNALFGAKKAPPGAGPPKLNLPMRPAMPAIPTENKAMSGQPLAVPRSDNEIPHPPPLPPDAASLGLGGGGQGAPPALDMAALRGAKKKAAAPVIESRHKAGKKMKGLFWTAIKPDVSNQSTLWSKVDLKKLDDLDLDYASLEESFSAVEVAARPSLHVKTKVAEASVLDKTRTQNVEISSRGLNKSPEDLVQMVLELDPAELTAEATEIVLGLVPTPSDISAIRGYKGPEEGLGKAGRLLNALSTIPRLKERLECHKIIFSWNKTMDSVKAGNQMLGRACQELTSSTSSTKLAKLLSVVLAVGNFLNGGSSRVAAAVKLDSLLKLNTVKAANGQRGTLLHFIVRQLQTKYPETTDFYADWTCVSAASGLSLSQLLADKKCLMVRVSFMNACFSCC
jgi:hypothetical protein